MAWRRMFRGMMAARAAKLASFLAPHIPRRGGRVLDFGTGDGLVAAELASAHGLDVVGLDTVDYRLAKELPFHLYRGGRLPFPDGAFDTTLSIFVLHHTDDPLFYLDELARVSRRTLVVLEDSYRNPVELFFTRWLDKVGNFIESGDVAVPYNFLPEATWARRFDELGMAIDHQQRFYNHALSHLVPRHVFYKLDKPEPSLANVA